MKKILIVFNGGTIGSTINNAVINVDESAVDHLIDLFYKNTDIEVQFDILQPMNVLSENFTPALWGQLYHSINRKDLNNYAGIIVTHGSDTLPYTSAFMGFLFNHIKKPLVLTASNYALGLPKSNGLQNFIDSVKFIVNSGIPGVFTIFGNDAGQTVVYLSTRIEEADPFHDQFNSFGKVDLGTMIDGNFVLNTHRLNPTQNELCTHRAEHQIKELRFDNEILAITLYPGLNYDFFDFSVNKPKAVLHTLYHSATACIQNGKYCLPGFIKKCRQANIDVYLTSFKNTNDDLYITSKVLLENGAIPLTNISFEAAVAKLWIAYNQNILNPIDYMHQEIYFEFLKW